jgi:hypothetical protein
LLSQFLNLFRSQNLRDLVPSYRLVLPSPNPRGDKVAEVLGFKLLLQSLQATVLQEDAGGELEQWVLWAAGRAAKRLVYYVSE